jgi:hypothetical protein
MEFGNEGKGTTVIDRRYRENRCPEVDGYRRRLN